MNKTRLDGISAVVFDAYGTLFNLNAMSEIARPLADAKTDALLDLWRRKQLEYSWLRSLTGQHTDFLQITADSLDYACAALGLDNATLSARLLDAYRTPTAYEEVPEMLSRLRAAGLGRAILSNGSPAMLASGVAAAGLETLLDAVLSVSSVGIFKPHPAVYRLAVNHFHVAPEQIAFVSSNGWDVAGAAAFGFQVAWVNRAGLPAERLPSGPSAMLSDLTALPALLGV